MSFWDWSTTPGTNGTVDGVNIAEGCPPAGINNAIRSVMALTRAAFSSALTSFFAGSSALPVANGGTGATDALGIRSAAGLGTIATQNANAVAITGGTVSGLSAPLAILSGGTGATTASAALAALGGLGVSAYSFGSTGYIKFTNNLILQWGSTSVTMDNPSAVTFPIAFTSWNIPVVSATALSGSVSNSQNTGLSGWTLTTLSIWNADDRTVTVPWFAVGV